MWASGDSSTSATVDVRVESTDKTILPPTEVTVESFDLQKYVHGNTPIVKDTPRAIHAIIRALETAGIDTQDSDQFNLGYGGNYIAGVNDLFEFDHGPNSGWMYYINHQYVPVGVLDREIVDGESIVLFYVDNYMDNTYSWFVDSDITVHAGEAFTVQQQGLIYNVSTNGQSKGPVDGATILVDNESYSKDGSKVQTDKDGKATLTLNKPGTYTLSAERENDQGEANITRPYAEVTVLEAPPADTAEPSIRVKGLDDGETVTNPELSFEVNVTDDVDSEIVPSVKVNHKEIKPQNDNTYSVTLSEGKNHIAVSATDQAGNTAVKDYNIFYQKKEKVTPSITESINKAITNMLQEGINSEWQAIGLVKAGKTVPDSYEALFKENIQSQIVNKMESNRVKITDIERLTMTAVALGKDPRNIEGLNLIELIYNSPERRGGYDTMTFQGNNGPIFALIALDTKKFDVPEDAKWTRQKLIDELLRTQNEDGSWNLNENFDTPSIDITAMAITGLSPYKDQSEVKEALDKAVAYLSSVQTDEGGFDGGDFVGGITSEATSQVIIGLTAYGIDPTSEQFTKNGTHLIDHLLSFQMKDGGFQHTLNDGISNSMATEQALQGLVAYDMYVKNQGSFYDFTERKIEPDPESPAKEEDNVIPKKENDQVKSPESSKDNDKNNDGNESPNKNVSDESKGDSGKKLPNTATNLYNILLIGVFLLVIGIIIFYIRKRRLAGKG